MFLEFFSELLKDGTSEIDLDEKSVVEFVNAAINSGVDAIVVSLLHSYANPKDEKIREIIYSIDKDIDVTLSSDVWPVIREYERNCYSICCWICPKKS